MKKLLYLLPVLAVLFAACEKEENAIKDNGQENTGTSGSSDTSGNTDSNTDNPDPISIPVGEAVDLGLSVKWANFNLGASKPEEYGLYFAWGELRPKTDYSGSNYRYGTSSTLTKYCTRSDYGYNGFVDNKIDLDPEDDAAHVNWGGDWRMPTKTEMEELRNNCTWTWTTLNGVNGFKVQSIRPGHSDKWIFLPAAGCHSGLELYFAGEYGLYWSSRIHALYPQEASYFKLDTNPEYMGTDTYHRSHGLSVRAVCP